MNTDVGVARWQELIDAVLAQKARLVRANPELYEMSQPNPGATEEELAAAEERLGHRVPAQYREFLTVANGWDGWGGIGGRLASTESISGGSGHEVSIRLVNNSVLEWDTDADWIRIENDPVSMILHRDSQGHPAGSVIRPAYGHKVYASFEEYMTEELADLTAWADREALGPHGAAWGRRLQDGEPTLKEIVRRLVDARLDVATSEHRLDGFTAPAAPATEEQLAAVEEAIGSRLHPEHRELLGLMNGWPGTPYILSTAEIVDGERWRTALAEKDRFDADHRRRRNEAFANAGIPIPDDDLVAASVRAAAIFAVPFGAWSICALGVDVDDGFVRWIPDDAKYGEAPGQSTMRSVGTVREYLLTEIDQLQTRLEALQWVERQTP